MLIIHLHLIYGNEICIELYASIYHLGLVLKQTDNFNNFVFERNMKCHKHKVVKPRMGAGS